MPEVVASVSIAPTQLLHLANSTQSDAVSHFLEAPLGRGTKMKRSATGSANETESAGITISTVPLNSFINCAI